MAKMKHQELLKGLIRLHILHHARSHGMCGGRQLQHRRALALD